MSDTTHLQRDSGNERPPTPAEIAARGRKSSVLAVAVEVGSPCL